MGQFLFGLLAGVVVGLVMEWVIDWAGLLPRQRAHIDHGAKSRRGGLVASKAQRAPEQAAPDQAMSTQPSNHTNADTIGE